MSSGISLLSSGGRGRPLLTLLNQHSLLPLPAGPLALEQRPVPIGGGDLERDSSLRRVLCARRPEQAARGLRALGWGRAYSSGVCGAGSALAILRRSSTSASRSAFKVARSM